MMKKIGLITSGGDSPGMNACIRAVVKTALGFNREVIGIEDGYQGMIEGRGRALSYSDVNNIIQLGGTVLGTARSEEFRTEAGRKKAIAQLEKWGIGELIVVGGDGSFKGAQTLSEESGISILGIPGTIDNDIFGTDHTIGFDTALNTAMEAIDRIRDTASSHHRIFFVEVMGRDAGFLALYSGLASGADEVLVPEEWTDLDALANSLREINKGKRSSIVIVAEGDDAGGAKEIVEQVQPHLKEFDLRVSILGHIQRGGRPSAFDRILATRLGSYAVVALSEGKNNIMLGVNGSTIVEHPLLHSVKKNQVMEQGDLDLLEKLRTKH